MNNEQRIRELAHQIWESEGCPDGQATRHWEMASKLLDSEQQGELQPQSPKKPATRKPRKKATAPPDNDETQLEKPALLGKPAGKPPKTRGQAIARTTKISEPGISDPDGTRE